MTNKHQIEEREQGPEDMDLATALRILNGRAGLRMPTDAELAGLMAQERNVQQDWLKTWQERQLLRKERSAADSAAIQAIGLLLDPSVIEEAIAREQDWRNDPVNKGKPFAPPNYRVPQGLRDALLKYKEQISKTERAVHDARFAAGQPTRSRSKH
jgi:hypothetical protein